MSFPLGHHFVISFINVGEVIFNGLLPESGPGLPFTADQLEVLRRNVRSFEDSISHLGAQRSAIFPVYEKGAQGHNVDPFQAVGYSLPISPEHLHIGQEMMRKQYWLGPLKMGVARGIIAPRLVRAKRVKPFWTSVKS